MTVLALRELPAAERCGMKRAEYDAQRVAHRRSCRYRRNYQDFDPPALIPAPAGYSRRIVDPLIVRRAKRSHAFAVRAAALAGNEVGYLELRDAADFFGVHIFAAQRWGAEIRDARRLAAVPAQREAQIAAWEWDEYFPDRARAYRAMPVYRGPFSDESEVFFALLLAGKVVT